METQETEEEIDLDTIVVSPDELLLTVEEGAAVYSELTANFIEKFEFYGQTLSEWATEMMIEIPQDIDEKQMRRILVELGNKYQRASNYYSVAYSLSKAFGGGSEMKKSDVINALVANYTRQNKKRPAGAILERMADSYLKSTVSTRVAAGIVRDFWKQRLDTMQDLRRLLEQIGMNLAVTMKFTSTQEDNALDTTLTFGLDYLVYSECNPQLFYTSPAASGRSFDAYPASNAG